MAQVLGYDLIIKVTDGATQKIMAGVTSNKFSIKPKVKESLTKEDRGNATKKLTGYDGELSASGLVYINEAGDEATKIDRDDLIRLAKAGTPLEIVYGEVVSGKTVQKGNAIITDFSEDSPAEDTATWSISLGGSGALADHVVAP